MANNRYRLKPDEEALIFNYRKYSKNNVLVIGDIHEPFTLDGYLKFCLEQYHKHECSTCKFKPQ